MSEETKVATTTVGGVTATSAMSPQEIFNAHLKAAGEAPIDFKGQSERNRIGGLPLHVHSNHLGALETTASVAPAKAPPAKDAPPATTGPYDASKVAAFDAEMRAKGLQTAPTAEQPAGAGATHVIQKDGQRVATPEMERVTETMALLGKVYRHRAASAETDKARDDLRGSYERDLRRAQEGRPRSEFELGLTVGELLVKQEATKEVKTTPLPSAHPPEAWAQAHVSVANNEGYIPLERINAAGLSGYKLPKLVDGQTYHVSIFQDLANARRQGFTQKQVEGFIRDNMVQNGWIKA